MTVVAIIQARMGSTRLPNKTMMEISGKPMLGHVIERLCCSKFISDIVVATSVNMVDRPISHYTQAQGITSFEGSETDVLSRFVGAACTVQAELVVRITGDCPLIDPGILDDMIVYHLAQHVEYTGNLARRTLPRGLDAEVFSLAALLKANEFGTKPHHREHVTPYIYEHPGLFSIASFEVSGELQRPDVRLCVDTQDDMKLIQKIYQEFYCPGAIVDVRKVVRWLDENPYWLQLNQTSEQEHLRRNQLDGVKQYFLQPGNV